MPLGARQHATLWHATLRLGVPLIKKFILFCFALDYAEMDDIIMA